MTVSLTMSLSNVNLLQCVNKVFKKMDHVTQTSYQVNQAEQVIKMLHV